MKRMFARKVIVTSVLVLASLSVILLGSGCAAQARCMVPKDFEVVNQHAKMVSINESKGGLDAKPLWNSQISDTAFTAALKKSLENSGVFNTVTTGDGADYILDITILNYDQPWYGANITVRMETKWELTNAKTHASVWSNTFETAYRASWLSSPFDGRRIEKAHERAVRTNIKEGIQRLSLLNL